MAQNYKACKTPGISYREHSSRKNGKIKDRYYRIRYQLNGKVVTEVLGWASQGTTEAKASAILAQLKENIRIGQHPQTLAEMRAMNEEKQREKAEEKSTQLSGILTFDEVFRKYIEQVKIDTTFTTYRNRKDRYRIYIQPFLTDKAMSEIKKQDIEDIKSNMISLKRADDTIKKTIAIISQVYKYATENDLYNGAIPTLNVKISNKDNKRQRYLTRDEARLLLEELKKHSIQVHDMALLCLYTGFRASEIRNLRWENVLWDTNRIFAKWRKNGNNDLIPMHPELRKMLEQKYKDKQSEFVFYNADNEKLKAISGTYHKVVEKIGLNAGKTDPLQKVVFHTLRHTYASWLVMKGVDLYTVQKLMGHKDISMTQRYAHLAPGHLEKAVNTLERI